MHRVRIWTDGCCLRNPGGRGGWAYVIEVKGRIVHQQSGGEPSSTNNRMELMAAVEALHNADVGSIVEIVSDSTYVVKGATSWMSTWKANGWTRRVYGGKKGEREEVANLALWQEMDRLIGHRTVRFSWIKGHDNHRFNERADELASAAARAA